MAEFEDARASRRGGQTARTRGYRCMDAYTPFPVEDLPEALGRKATACR